MTIVKAVREWMRAPAAISGIIKRGWARVLGILRGRTGRMRMEEALRRCGDELHLVTDPLTLAIGYVDPELRYLFTNREYEEWVQRSREEIRGQHVREILGEPVYERIRGHLEAALSGQRVTYEATLPYREKGLRNVSVTYSPYFSARGEVEGFVALVADTTERKRAEEALRRNDEQLRLITDGVDACISYVDSKQRYRFNNKTYEEWFGRSRDQITGRHIREVIGESAYEASRGYVAAVLSGEQVKYESVVPLKDAGTRDLSLTLSPCLGQRGQVDGFVALITDITERKRADEALRVSEEKYRDLVENINDVIYEVDASGDITYVSPVVEQISGYSPRELTGGAFLEFVHPDDREEVLEGLQRTLGGDLEPIEFRVSTKPGEVRWVRVFSRPVVEEGRAVSLRGVLTDITERKRAEEERLREREELEGRVERQMLRRNPYGLTFRELTVLHLVAAGRSDKEIGAELGISPLTAQKHTSNILAKMEASSRTDAGVRAVREGLLE